MSDDGSTRRTFVLGTGAAAAFGLAGCTGFISDGSSNGDGENDSSDASGDGHGDDHGDEIGGPSASATVTMATIDDGTHFEPHVVWVEQGGTVTWELESGSHTTTAYSEAVDRPQRIPDAAEGWDSGTLSEAGTTFEHTFETKGVYDYFCKPHEGSGMLGSVIVGDPGTDGHPGLEPPQNSLPDGAATKIESLNERVVATLEGSQDGGHSESHNETESHHDDGGH